MSLSCALLQEPYDDPVPVQHIMFLKVSEGQEANPVATSAGTHAASGVPVRVDDVLTEVASWASATPVQGRIGIRKFTF